MFPVFTVIPIAVRREALAPYTVPMRRELFVLMFIVTIAVIAGAALYSSEKNTSGNSAVDPGGQAAVEVPFTRITEGLQSDVSRRVNYLVTSQSALEKLWTMVKATGTPPTIDFTKEAVIAVFAGEKPTAGYEITVSKVRDSADARIVAVSVMQPAPDCVTAQMVTMPYEILTVPATPLPLTHEDSVLTVNCPD